MTLVEEESGQALIEFALFSTLFILLFAGIVDYSIYIHMQTELNESASAAAGIGATVDNQEQTTAMYDLAYYSAPDIASKMTINTTYFYTCTQGGAHVTNTTMCGGSYPTPLMYVQVTTSAPIPPALKWSGLPGTLTLQGAATYRVRWRQ